MEFPALRGRSILMVEDELLIGMDIRDALEQAGAQVTATTTVRHALILIEHDGLAAAIMDHALADGDSAEVCARVTARVSRTSATVGTTHERRESDAPFVGVDTHLGAVEKILIGDGSHGARTQ
jgi:DNA-binding response OmpR family regulator